jgi:DNA modification methylase
MIKRNHVYPGDVLEVLRGLPEKSVSMSMSSPPYWSLRDYGIPPSIWDGDGTCESGEHEYIEDGSKPDFKYYKDDKYSGPGHPKGQEIKHKWEEVKPARHHTPGDIPSEGSILDKSKRGPTELRPGLPSAFCTKCGAWRGCLGLEPTPELFIKHLCDIYDEVKRVTRDDGTCWVNLGDTYGGSGGAGNQYERFAAGKGDFTKYNGNKAPAKSLVCIPFMFAMEMINRGWILRNVIIWHKNNCMPSSARDRFTIDFEYLFFFSKKQKYYFEQQFEAFQTPGGDKPRKTVFGSVDDKDDCKGTAGFSNATYRGRAEWVPNTLGRNKRAVWNINTKSYKEAHFATYPPELCETPISAGCPKEICTACGTPRERILSRDKSYWSQAKGDKWDKPDDEIWAEGSGRNDGYKLNTQLWEKHNKDHPLKFKGYSSCSCNAPFKPGIVLDPFFGSGTTGEVAESLGRDWIGIEINPDYIELAMKRLEIARVARKNKKNPNVVKRYKKNREDIENGKQETLF